MRRFDEVTIRWRAIVFAGTLFWFWYLGPTVESRVIARVILLLQP
jgi:hypothetical protein